MTQACPNCHKKHDVAVYVTGQKLLCACGIRFEVRRTDVSSIQTRPGGAVTGVGRAAAAPGAGGGASAVVPPGASMVYAPTHVPPSSGGGRELGEVIHLESAHPGAPARNEAVAGAAPQPPAGAAEPDSTFVSAGQSQVPEAFTIPGYDLLDVLGRGGMGEVWRARQRSLGRTVAVKILPPKLAKDPEFVTRFEKEATALAALSHPHVIQIIDRGVAGEHYYFVMEYVAGRSLRDVMNAGRLPAAEALKVVAQICRAIDYAHEQQIIHRDLKPENILIDERGHVKVADFGLAGMRGEQRLQLTATAVAMGTVNYMAPEQRRDAKNVDGRADLYSVGVMLYEMLTGELPIGRFKLPSECVNGLDVRLDQIVARSLETDPQARFQRASEVGRAVESMITSGISVGGQLLAAAEGQGVSPSPTLRDRPAHVSPGSPPSRSAAAARAGLQGVKTGLAVVGALALIAVGARQLAQRDGQEERAASDGARPRVAQLAPPPNTNGELFVQAQVSSAGAEVYTTFQPSTAEHGEEMNAHAGAWKLEGGRLRVTQVGNELSEGKLKLVPRAYVAHRYFNADEFIAEVKVHLSELEAGYALEPDVQRFAEVAFRIKDLQVSAFAIPGVGMRMGWRYYTPSGEEVQGNSSRDVTDLTEDETPVPMGDGPFRMSIRLKRVRGGVEASAYVNDQRFARKILAGLENQVGKVALGCRNLHCEFAELDVRGKAEVRPGRRAGAGAE